MRRNIILSVCMAITVLSSISSAQPLVCALKVETQGLIQCKAQILGSLNGGATIGGFGSNIALKINNNTSIFSNVVLTDNEHLEQHIRIEEKASHGRLSSSSLFTSIGSFTVLEAKGLNARLRCLPFTGEEETAKNLICQ